MTRWLVGTYGPDSQGTGEGIYAAHEDAGGRLVFDGLAVACPSPSYLIRDGDRVHAALEAVGRVATIVDDRIEREVDAGGAAPCHLLGLNGAVVVANYVSGTVAVLGPEGPTQILPGAGSGPRPGQDGPHAHATLAIGDTLLSTDLGADRIHLHAVRDTGLERTGALALPAGTGPRDLALHASGRVIAIGELDGSMHVIELDDAGARVVASVTVPGWVEGDHLAAIGQRGDLLYTAVRGSDRIAVLRFDGATLEPVADVDCGGAHPRHLIVDGELLHVANQHSNGVSSFRLGADGIPVAIGDAVEVPSPAFLLRVS